MNNFNNGGAPARLSINTTKGKLTILFAILITIGIITVFTASCVNSCNKEEPPVSTADVTPTDTSPTDKKPDYGVETIDDINPLDYGVLTVEQAMEDMDNRFVAVLNPLESAEDVLTCDMRNQLEGKPKYYYNGVEIKGDFIPERKIDQYGNVEWSKQVYIDETLEYVEINIMPEYTGTLDAYVTYPDGEVLGMKDDIFTFPYHGVIKWRDDAPVGGIYTFTLKGQDISGYYIAPLSFK